MGLFCVEHRTAISKTDDSSWECWKCLIKRAEQAERERDEARAKVERLEKVLRSAQIACAEGIRSLERPAHARSGDPMDPDDCAAGCPGCADAELRSAHTSISAALEDK